MKANEAPERIWIDNLDEGFWFDSPSGNKSIEYIRKDTFIEKAYTYLNEKCRRFILTAKDIDDFIKYIKGE